MSTTKTDTSTAQFAPSGMGAYNAMMGPGTGGGGGFGDTGAGSAPGFMGGGKFGGGPSSFMQFPGGGQPSGQQGGFGNVVANYINNPFGNPFMQTQQQMGTSQAHNMGGTQMSNLIQNMLRSGMQGGASSPAGLEMQQNQARANSGMQANLGFLQPMMNALGMQQNAMNIAGNFKPLQTGQTQTEKTSGTGTWLPQLAGAALGGLTGGLGGGLGSLMSMFRGGPMGASGVGSQYGPTGMDPNMNNAIGSVPNNVGMMPMPSLFGYGGGGGGYGGPGMAPPPMPGQGFF